MNMIRIVQLLILAKADSVFEPFAGYLENTESCQACINMIGGETYSTVCLGEGADENYCCNDAPSEPPNSNSQMHDPYSHETNVNTYLDFYSAENKVKRDSHSEFCDAGKYSCFNVMSMHLALDYCFHQSESRVGADAQSTTAKCQDAELSVPLFDGTKPNFMKNAGQIEDD